MKILQRYYLNAIMKLSLAFSLIIVILYLVTDLFNNLSYYINKHAHWIYILKYYILQSPALFIMFFPLGLLTAIYFSLAHRERWNENSAVKSLGIDLSSITNIILYMGIVLTILFTLFNLYLVPKFNKLSDEIKADKIDYIVSQHRYERNIYFLGSNHVLYTANYLDTKKKKLYTLTILKNSPSGQIEERDDCNYAIWNGKFWQLFFVKRRRFNGAGNVINYNKLQSLNDTSLSIPPRRLLSNNYTVSNMTITELSRFAHYMKSIGQTTKRIYTQIYYLLFYPVSILILSILGISLGSISKGSSNLFEFGLSLLIGFFYWGTLQSFRALGDAGGMSPLLANIMPHLLFFIITILTVFWAKRARNQR